MSMNENSHAHGTKNKGIKKPKGPQLLSENAEKGI
jgi:hypothetical protein